jgi:hypothetical protein
MLNLVTRKQEELKKNITILIIQYYKNVILKHLPGVLSEYVLFDKHGVTQVQQTKIK